MKRWIKKILLVCVLSLSFNNANAKPHDFSDMTIVVNSCDKYEELWGPFFKILFMKWPELEKGNIPIVLITNGKEFKHPAVTVYKSQNESTWSDTFGKALSTVKTKYVLYLQEDYFLTHLDLDRLDELFAVMKKENAGYMQLYGPTQEERIAYTGVPNLFYKNKFEKWRTSLQAAFWNKEIFAYLLNPAERIWDFEIAGSTRSEGNMSKFMTTIENDSIAYLNMAAEGSLVDTCLAEAKHLYGIEWETKLPLQSEFNFKRFLRKEILSPVYRNVWLPFKAFLTSIIGVI